MRATRVLNWGLLGTARINHALIPPLRMSPRNRLVAVASRTQARGREFAAEWEIPKVYAGYEAMLAAPDIDVVYIPLPNGLHAEWTVKAAQAGKHVLCEKPLAISLSEVDAIIEAAQKAGVVVAEAFMYRHHPQTLKVKELVDGGAVGDLQLVRGSFSFNLTRPDDVRLIADLGGGSIWDVGCYPISYARMIAGCEPQEVFGWQVTGPQGVDLAFAGQMRFPNGVMAQFDSSFRSPYRVQIEIVGSEGALTVPVPFAPGENESITLRRGEETQRVEFPGQHAYLGEVEDLADAILEGKAPRLSLADSRKTVATILALLRSAQTGLPVTLP